MMIDPLDQLRLEQAAKYLHSLGARPLAQFLAEGPEEMPALLRRLEAYRHGPSAEVLAFTRGDQFRRLFRLVPADLGEDMP
jgi:hypothetical protein